MGRQTKAVLIYSAVMLAALFIGAIIRPSGIHDPPPAAPGTTDGYNVTPEPLMARSAAASTAYVERSVSCRNPANAAGYCWYEGWAFTRKTVCIDSSIPGAPLTEVAKLFTGPGGIRVIVGGRAGSCAANGQVAGQRVTFVSMSKNTVARYGRNVCGLTSPANYGNLNSISVAIYVTGAKRTPCGSGAEWLDVWAHEMGHTFGLSHKQPAASSIMRDGHWPDRSDRAKLAQIYTARRA